MVAISGSKGFAHISFTAAEMNYSAVAVWFGCTTAKASLMSLSPRNLASILTGTCSAGAAGTVTINTPPVYDITGCFIHITSGTGTDQARRITGYAPATGVVTVTPNWETNPANTDAYSILLPEGVTPSMVIGTAFLRRALAQAGTVAAIQLDSGASSVNGFYVGCQIAILSGTGAGQIRTIVAYNGASKQATLDRVLVTAPTSASQFAILLNESPTLNASLQVTANVARVVVATGTAQAGTATTITLNAGALATNDIFVSNIITITSGTGAGQSRTIVDYVGSTKVATVDKAWVTNPGATSVFDIYASNSQTVFSDQGVLQSATGTTAVLGDQASAVDDIYNGSLLVITAGTGSGQSRIIDDYVGSTKTATVVTWSVTPDSTSVYAVIPTVSGQGTPGTDPLIQAIYDEIVLPVTEPGQGAPPVAATRGQKTDYQYKFLRNKVTDDGATVKVYDDSGATVDQKASVSDAAGVTTRDEFGSGP